MPDPIEQPPTDTTLPPATDDPFAAEREAVRQQVLAEAQQAYGAAIRDAEQRAMQAQQQLQQFQQTPPQTPAKTPDSTEFFADPYEHTRRLIKEELTTAVQPLNQFAHQMQQQQMYGAIKNQLRLHPQLAAHFGKIEGILDQESAGLTQININSVGALAINIVGRAMLGMIPGVNLGGAPVAAPPGAPPQIPPAPPRAPQAPTQQIQLTEDQLRLAKLNGMTPEQYHAYTMADGSIDSLRKIGKPNG